MKFKNSVSVVIPIYKEFDNLTANEIKSLHCGKNILKSYTFILVAPLKLKLEAYINFFEKNCLSIRFANQFFQDINGYNNLLLNPLFYHHLLQSKYILLYQPDAWVFNDQLQHWINKGYDYIGAPWFSSMTVSDPNASIVGVGNGGFSLRNTRKMHSVLTRINRLRKLNKIWQHYKLESIWSFQKMVLRFNFYFKIAKFWELHYILDESPVQEDVFLCFKAASVFSDFNVAPPEEAMQFSFEVNPSLLYKMNHNQLPFGCHAWEKYEPEFWKNFIPFENKKTK